MVRRSGLGEMTGPAKVYDVIPLVDDAPFCDASLSNFLWVTFTRSNSAADIIVERMGTQHFMRILVGSTIARGDLC